MKPQVEITGFVDEMTNTYMLKRVFYEDPEAYRGVEYTHFTNLDELHNAIERLVEISKENTYDYKVNFITF